MCDCQPSAVRSVLGFLAKLVVALAAVGFGAMLSADLLKANERERKVTVLYAYQAEIVAIWNQWTGDPERPTNFVSATNQAIPAFCERPPTSSTAHLNHLLIRGAHPISAVPVPDPSRLETFFQDIGVGSQTHADAQDFAVKFATYQTQVKDALAFARSVKGANQPIGDESCSGDDESPAHNLGTIISSLQCRLAETKASASTLCDSFSHELEREGRDRPGDCPSDAQ